MKKYYIKLSPFGILKRFTVKGLKLGGERLGGERLGGERHD